MHMCHIVIGDDRKEKVLHTRVPERLEIELKERAAELGMSVSNLVRNVLTHAFDLVGDVVADSAEVARRATGVRRGIMHEERTPDPDPFRGLPSEAPEDVLGWQPMILQRNAVCAMCNDILPRGSDAAIAISDVPGTRAIVCNKCLEELRR